LRGTKHQRFSENAAENGTAKREKRPPTKKGKRLEKEQGHNKKQKKIQKNRGEKRCGR